MSIRADRCVGWFPGWRSRRARAAACRGFALFAGAFLLADAVAGAADAWLVDVRSVPSAAAPVAAFAAAVMLAWYAVSPNPSALRRAATVSAAAVLGLVAVRDMARFYEAWAGGAIVPASPLPLSAAVAVAFGAVAVQASRRSEATSGRRAQVATVAATLAFAAVFPLAQGLFFGCTDYRRPADVAIVPGAKAYPDGRLSTALEDRVTTAVSLYREGLVDRLIMSGAVGREGIDEALAMRRRAIELGVPPDRVQTDSEGADTEATARNAVCLLRDGEDVLVVSQPYHLPRLKLAFASAGVDVRTVPAIASRPIAKTPIFAVREIGGFWVYWARSTMARIGWRVWRAVDRAACGCP